MKRLFYLLFGLVLLPALLYAQGSLSPKDINDNLTNNYYNKTASDARYATTTYGYSSAEVDILLAPKADKTYVNATDEAIISDNDSQDVQIEANRVAITLKATQIDMDSAEAKINDLDIINDSQDVQIESNRVAITLKADSDEIHTDISQAYVNVKEFGAVGDGIVDDAAAINSAIASLTSGGVVLFPSGYYCIKSQITLTGKHGLTLRGVGHGENTTYLGTNIYATGYNGHHFRGIDCVGVSIENMNLTAEGQDSSFGVGGIYFSISSNSNNPYHTFKNLFISDISNNGISIGTPIMTNFNNVTVRKCVGSSFNLWSGTSTTWTNCYANNATEAGWLLTGMTYCTLQGCAAESAGVGFYFDNSKSISLMGCGTEAIINRGGAFNGYAYRSINGSNAITLYDCYDRISETGSLDESAGGLLDYINHKTDSNAQITKIHSLPASTSTYTDTYDLGVTDVQSALDTIELWLSAIDVTDDSQDVAINAHLIDATGAHTATAISTTSWDNVQTCLDSLETAIQSIVVGSGFALESWVNSTLETNFYTKAQTNATIEAAIAAIPAPSVNQTITVQAGEDLSAGDVVSLINSGGTMKAYNNALTVSTSPNGAESVFNAAATSYCSAVVLDSSRFLVAYQKADTKPYARVGTVSGSTISWGTESSAFENIWAQYISAVTINTNKVLVFYKNNTAGGGRMVVLTVSTSTISIGTPANFLVNLGNPNGISSCKLDTDKALVCYVDSNSKGRAKVVTVSSTTPTPAPTAGDNGTDFNDAAIEYVSCSALSSTSAIVAYQDGGNSNYGTAQVLSISGTTITPGTEYVYKSETAYYVNTLSLSSTSAIICDVSASGTWGKCYAASIAGTEITYGTVTQLNVYASYFSIAKISPTQVMWIGGDVTNNYGQSCLLTITGTDISAGSFYAVNPSGTGSYYTTCYLGNNKTILAYTDVGNSNYGTAVVNQWATSSYASVSGISSGAYSSGSDAVVLISGVSDDQSDLIVGSPYFLQSDFTIGTTPISLAKYYNSSTATGEIKIGTAKSATELIIGIDYK